MHGLVGPEGLEAVCSYIELENSYSYTWPPKNKNMRRHHGRRVVMEADWFSKSLVMHHVI